jgi:micrococcal nuclease
VSREDEALGNQTQQLTETARPAPAYQYRLIVRRVIDGDTVVGDIDLGMEFWQHNQSIRLLGINTPERKGETRAAGDAAMQHLLKLLAALALRVEPRIGSTPTYELIVRTKLDKQEKFGRLLGTLIGRDPGLGCAVDLNQRMIDDGHAVPFMA